MHWADIRADKLIGYLQRTDALGSMAYIPEFKRTVAAALRDEREACAKIVENAKLDGCAEFRDRVADEIRNQ